MGLCGRASIGTWGDRVAPELSPRCKNSPSLPSEAAERATVPVKTGSDLQLRVLPGWAAQAGVTARQEGSAFPFSRF